MAAQFGTKMANVAHFLTLCLVLRCLVRSNGCPTCPDYPLPPPYHRVPMVHISSPPPPKPAPVLPPVVPAPCPPSEPPPPPAVTPPVVPAPRPPSVLPPPTAVNPPVVPPPRPPYVVPTPPSYKPPHAPTVPVQPPTVPCPPPPVSSGTCPIDALNLGGCLDLLAGLISIGIGRSPTDSCCSAVDGLADLDAAICLCTTIRAKALNINIFFPIALDVLVNQCGKTPPPGFNCDD